MKKSIDQWAATTAHAAQNQAAMIQGELRALRDSMSGLTRNIRAPVIKTPRTKTKTVRRGSIANEVLGITNIVTGGNLGDSGLIIGNSFYSSTSQSASAQSDLLSFGQRIR